MEYLMGILLLVIGFILWPKFNSDNWDGTDIMPSGDVELKKIAVKKRTKKSTTRAVKPKVKVKTKRKVKTKVKKK